MMCFPTDTSKYFGCTKSCLPLMLNNCKPYLGSLHNFKKNISWQYNSLLALLWGECPIIYTQRLMRLDLQYSHIFTVFMIDFMIDFDKCYKYLLLCIDMIPTLWSIMSQILLDC